MQPKAPRQARRSRAARACLYTLLTACGADSGDFPRAADASGPGSGDTVLLPGDHGGSNAPQAEEATGDLEFQSPQAGKSVVFVPNPITNRVAVVNGSSYLVETFASGTTPRAVATVPGEDIALVVNEGSSDVSLLRTVDGVTSLLRVPIGHPINAIAIAADGAHALVYYASVAGVNGADTHQDASVIALTGKAPAVWAVSVGFRPRAVRFSADGSRAFAITDDGVSAITFDDRAKVLSVEQIGLGNVLSSGAADVQISADGAYAVARSDGRAEITLVDLATHAIRTLALADLQPASARDGGAGALDGGSDAGADAGPSDAGSSDAGTAQLPPGQLELTDLDVSPDGAHAFAVLRSSGLLLDIPVPAGFDDYSLIRSYPVGEVGVGALRIAKDGKLGVLYSTVTQLPRVQLVDLTQLDQPARTLRLRKTVRAVAIADDAAHLFILHSGAQSGGPSSTDAFTASEGFSLVSVADAFAKFEPTGVPIRDSDILVTPDGTRIFSLLRGTASGAVLVSDLETLRTQRTDLARNPSSIGILPDVARVFVGQESEGGMITFLDQADGSVERDALRF